MTNNKQHPTGWTRATGFQVGARRTLPIAPDAAWRLLMSPAGLSAWLGLRNSLELVKGSTYALPDGTQGEIRVFQPLSHIRLTWQPPDWERASTIQVRVTARGAGTTIAFHQEHLPHLAACEARRQHFQQALDTLETMISIT
jgi:uncharacterized protein YndB with AHSA1/START domain